MTARIRNRLTYSNVISSIALFAALTGVAVAAGVPQNSVGNKQLKNGAVSTKKLHREAVTNHKLGAGAVTQGKISGAAITNSKLANGAVTNSKLGNGSVNSSKLGANSVTNRRAQKRRGQHPRSWPARRSPPADQKRRRHRRQARPRPPAHPGREPGRRPDPARGLRARRRRENRPHLGDLPVPAGQRSGLPEQHPQTRRDEQRLPEQRRRHQTAGGSRPALPLHHRIGRPSESVAFADGSVKRLGFGLFAGFTEPNVGNNVEGVWAVTAP